MIRPLRLRHRVAVCALGTLLPVAFFAGLSARRPLPLATALPRDLVASGGRLGQVVWSRSDLWPGRRILSSLKKDVAGSLWLELAVSGLLGPEVLVYWTTGSESTGGVLPMDARLIGRLANGAPLFIAAGLRGQTGRLVLYSLADQAMVAMSSAFDIQRN